MIKLLNKLIEKHRKNKRWAVIEFKGRFYAKEDINHEYTKRKFNSLPKALDEADKLNEKH